MKIICSDPGIENPPLIKETIEVPDKELEGLKGFAYVQKIREHFNKWVLKHSRASFEIIKD